jgi:hypothetical protein
MNGNTWTSSWWWLWTIAMFRPSRVDDENVPDEIELVPSWDWRRELQRKYGDENVVRKTKDNHQGLWDSHPWQATEPAPTDECIAYGQVCKCISREERKTIQR